MSPGDRCNTSETHLTQISQNVISFLNVSLSNSITLLSLQRTAYTPPWCSVGDMKMTGERELNDEHEGYELDVRIDFGRITNIATTVEYFIRHASVY